MDPLVATGSGCLGVVVGWMVYSTFVRQERVDAKVLGSIVSVMVGAGVIGIFQAIAGSKSGPLPREVYTYPIGLLIGVVATPTIKFISETETRSEQEKLKKQEASLREQERLEQLREKERLEQIREQARLDEIREKGMKDAKDVLIRHITGKGYEMMSFETLRRDLGRPDWSDDFFHAVIFKYPGDLRNATLKGNRRGVAVLPH